MGEPSGKTLTDLQEKLISTEKMINTSINIFFED